MNIQFSCNFHSLSLGTGGRFLSNYKENKKIYKERRDTIVIVISIILQSYSPLVTKYNTNVTITNYFIIFLQNIDVTNLLFVFI